MIAVIDYGIGNLASACRGLQAEGADAMLVVEPDEVETADGVVLPGVGSFGRCMDAVVERDMDRAVRTVVARGTPFLGICVGFQMLYRSSEESPGTPGLGLLEGTVVRLPPGEKHPQMQWNALERVGDSAMLTGLRLRPWVYFVHSYAPLPEGFGPGNLGAGGTVAVCEYGGPVVAAVEHGRIWGTQFHPEKSGTTGLAILRNFIKSCNGGGRA